MSDTIRPENADLCLVLVPGTQVGRPQLPLKCGFALGPKTVPSSLLKLSRNTVRLATTEPVPLNSTIELHFPDGDYQTTESILARVSSVKPGPDGQWYVGCKLAMEIPTDVISQLAAKGYYERRKDKRFQIAVTATVRRELEMDQTMIVRVDNYSAGGFAMFAPDQFAHGERLMLEIGGVKVESSCFPARVVWQRQIGDANYVGCCFVTKEGTGQVVEIARAIALAEACQRPDEHAAGKLARLQKKLAACGSAVRGLWERIRSSGPCQGGRDGAGPTTNARRPESS